MTAESGAPAPFELTPHELTPHEPAVMHPEIPPLEAAIGPQVEDFVVDEIPLYAHSGAGEHVYVRVASPAPPAWTNAT